MKVEISKKNNYLTLFLCIFFGFLGLHNFYVGQKGNGIAKLIILLISFSIFLICYLSAYDVNLHDPIIVNIRIKAAYKLFFQFEILAIIWIIWEFIVILRQRFKDAKGLYLKF